MKTLIGALTGLAALLVNPTISRAADDPAAIVDKAIKALGGEELLAKTKVAQWKAKGTMHAFGMKMPYVADYAFAAPDKLRFDVTGEFGGQKMSFSAGTDGTANWEKSGDTLQDMAKKKAEAFQHNLYSMSVAHLLPLKNKDFTLANADDIKIDDKPAVGVKVSKKGHPDVTLWFDKATGHLVKYQTPMWDEFSDKEVMQEVFFTGYGKIGDRMCFGKLSIKRDGQQFLEEELSDQKSLDKIDPKLFAKP